MDRKTARKYKQAGKLPSEMRRPRKTTAIDAQYAYRRACYGGEASGCTALGDLYFKGKGGIAKSPELAPKFYDRGCRAGDHAACYGFAEGLRTGKGIAKDVPRAKALYPDACNAGFTPACARSQK